MLLEVYVNLSRLWYDSYCTMSYVYFVHSHLLNMTLAHYLRICIWGRRLHCLLVLFMCLLALLCDKIMRCMFNRQIKCIAREALIVGCALCRCTDVLQLFREYTTQCLSYSSLILLCTASFNSLQLSKLLTCDALTHTVVMNFKIVIFEENFVPLKLNLTRHHRFYH